MACLLIAFVAAPATAQQAQSQVMPRISIVHPGAQALENDLKALFRLTNRKEQAQWKNLEEFLEQFKDGLNVSKPIRTDFLAEQSSMPMRMSLPVDDISAFRSNIEALGIESGRAKGADRRDKTLFQLKETYEGFLRYINGYASISKKKNDIAGVLLGNPAADIANLIARKYNIGAEIVNTKLDAASRDLRRKKFDAIRTELMAAIKKKPDETKAAYALRRTIVKHQMDEAERLLADVDRLTAGIKLATNAESASFATDLKAISGSDLSKTIQEFGKTPSVFANVKRNEDAVLSLRVTHPIDAMRKKNFTELWAKILPNSLERIEKTELSADEKTGAKQLAEHILSMLALGSDAGVVDAFVEVTPANGKHTMVTGLKVPEGADLVKMLELLPKANTQQKLEKSVAKVGETDIHKLTLSNKYQAEFNDFFGNDGIVFIGTSPSGLWTAIGGADAQDKLKAAIEQAAEETEADSNAPSIDVIAHLRPWIDLQNKLEARLPVPKSKKAKSRRQEARDLRRRALDAMTPADDVIKFRIVRVEDRLEGITEYGTGVTRLVGKLLAKFTKEQLDY
jgi:hypothetical protein